MNKLASALSAAILIFLAVPIAFATAPRSPRIDTVELLEDQGWDTSDPSLIWYDNFDGPDDLAGRYLEYVDDDGEFRPVAYEALGKEGQSLGGIFQPGEVSAGNIKKCFGRNPIDYRGHGVRQTEDFREIHWRFYMKLEDGWEGNPFKVSRASIFVDSSWSRAMSGYIWEGASDNVEMDAMTRVDGNGNVTGPPGWNGGVTTWLGARQSPYQVYDPDESGRWVSIESHIKLNTPGLSDGEQSL